MYAAPTAVALASAASAVPEKSWNAAKGAVRAGLTAGGNALATGLTALAGMAAGAKPFEGDLNDYNLGSYDLKMLAPPDREHYYLPEPKYEGPDRNSTWYRYRKDAIMDSRRKYDLENRPSPPFNDNGYEALVPQIETPNNNTIPVKKHYHLPAPPTGIRRPLEAGLPPLDPYPVPPPPPQPRPPGTGTGNVSVGVGSGRGGGVDGGGGGGGGGVGGVDFGCIGSAALGAALASVV